MLLTKEERIPNEEVEFKVVNVKFEDEDKHSTNYYSCDEDSIDGAYSYIWIETGHSYFPKEINVDI